MAINNEQHLNARSWRHGYEDMGEKDGRPGPVSIIVLGGKNLAQINILPRNYPRWGNFPKSVSINIFGPEFPQELPNFPPNVGQLLS